MMLKQERMMMLLVLQAMAACGLHKAKRRKQTR